MIQAANVLSVLVLSTVATALIASVLVGRYRRRMITLMRRTASSSPTPSEPSSPPRDPPPPTAPSRPALRSAGRRLTAWLVLVSAVVAASAAATWLAIAFPGKVPTASTVVVFALVYSWPAVPAIGLLWRWRRRQVLAALLVWAALCYPVILLQQLELRFDQPLWFLVSEVGFLPLVTVLFLGNRTRAVAPWLLAPVAGLVAASHVGLALLYDLVERDLRLVTGIATYTGVLPLVGLAAALPWLLAALPTWGLARGLGRAYRGRWFSDLLASFTGLWAFSLVDKSTTLVDAHGPVAFTVLLSLLWIPLAVLVLRPSKSRRPPTFLVLRVFQQDRQVQALYDTVVDRFRLVGPTVMIAGTDLADRTIDADHVFAYLGGRLPERFVATPPDVARRLDALHMGPDLDGRFRVDPCYCSDHTWRSVLTALVGRSDLVLMDLRGFQRTNEGCLFELGTLAASERRLRVVVLVDERTDRTAAQAAIGGAPGDRFEWVEVRDLDRATRRRVLGALFAERSGSRPLGGMS